MSVELKDAKLDIEILIHTMAEDKHIGLTDMKWRLTGPSGTEWEVVVHGSNGHIADQKFTTEQIIGFKTDEQFKTQVCVKVASILLQLESTPSSGSSTRYRHFVGDEEAAQPYNLRELLNTSSISRNISISKFIMIKSPLFVFTEPCTLSLLKRKQKAISSITDVTRDLSIHTCRGHILTDDIKKKIRAYYKGKPARNMIWDFTEADLSRNSYDDIRKFAHEATFIMHSREGGKTAIVSKGDVSFGLSRMYQIFAELEKQSVPVKVFRSIQEAERWIFGEAAGGPPA